MKTRGQKSEDRGRQRSGRAKLLRPKVKVAAHPSQPLVVDDQGVVRFKQNAIVNFLLRHGGQDMNSLALLHFTDEDRAQFAQLIGYSVCGWGELSYVLLAKARRADAAADQLLAKGGRP